MQEIVCNRDSNYLRESLSGHFNLMLVPIHPEGQYEALQVIGAETVIG
jgi:hypothetical protein